MLSQPLLYVAKLHNDSKGGRLLPWQNYTVDCHILLQLWFYNIMFLHKDQISRIEMDENSMFTTIFNITK
jgi:hypothetical protein